jgi:predicted secreted protein
MTPGGPPFAEATARQAIQAVKRPIFALRATPDRQVLLQENPLYGFDWFIQTHHGQSLLPYCCILYRKPCAVRW